MYFFLLCLLCIVPFSLQAQSFNSYWRRVEQAQEKNLPQTVIRLSEEIASKARREHNAPQLLKATLCKNHYQQQLTPDSLYLHLKQLETWSLQEQNPVSKAILHSLLADDYALYLLNNRAEVRRRTPLKLSQAPADVREWTVNQFITAIDAHCQASVLPLEVLLEASAEDYVPFIELQEDSRYYLHDMYHLLAGRAIDIYRNFHLSNADSLKKIRIGSLYQTMLNAYGQREETQDAFLLTSVDYLDWRYNRDPEACLQALDSLIADFGTREVCAEAYMRKADLLRQREIQQPAEALRVCAEALRRYPKYKRVNRLKNIQAEILQPYMEFDCVSGNYPANVQLAKVRYSNLTGFSVHFYRTDYQALPKKQNEEEIDAFKKASHRVSSVHYDLTTLPQKGIQAANWPYLKADTTLMLQVPEQTGIYLMQIVPDQHTASELSILFTVSRLKSLAISHMDGTAEVLVVDARTGHPIPGAEVCFYDKDDTLLSSSFTQQDGRTSVKYNNKIRYYSVSLKGEQGLSKEYFYTNRTKRWNPDEKQTEVTLITDRSVYRPGQTVHVKGIAYEQGYQEVKILEDKEVEVKMIGSNLKELFRKRVVTNEFGSFATSFVLPSSCLNGHYYLKTDVGDTRADFSVEEYKRPTFELQLDPIKEAYRLGDSVRMTGTVRNFTGVSVRRIPVHYTLTPTTHRRRYKELAQMNDTVYTDIEGRFTLPLKLKPLEADDLAANFQLKVTAIDHAGEAHTVEKQLYVLQRALSFRGSLPDAISKENLPKPCFTVENQMDQKLPLTGTYRLYRSPQVDLSQIEPRGDRPLLIVNGAVWKHGFDSRFLPSYEILSMHVLRGQEALQKYGAAGTNGVIEIYTRQQVGSSQEEPVLEATFESGKPLDCSAWEKLPSGNYTLRLSATDSQGREEESNVGSFTLFSKSDSRLSDSFAFFHYAESLEFSPEKPACVYLGTSFKDTYIYMDVFSNRRRIDSSILQLSDTLLTIRYPYKEELGEEVSLKFTFVKDGKSYTTNYTFTKQKPSRKLDLQWNVFRDRLKPGQTEEWKLTIRTPQGTPAYAELLASMYDASLDKIRAYRPSFGFNFLPRRGGSPYYHVTDFERKMMKPFFMLSTQSVPMLWLDNFYLAYSLLQEEKMVTTEGVVMSARMVGSSTRVSNEEAVTVNYVAPKETDGYYMTVEEAPEIESPAATSSTLRTNFSETAFFYPQLRTNEQGEVSFSFTLPQSLTRWNFRGFAHTKELLSGVLEASTVAYKEFMLKPNMPRFVRVGDKTQLAATLTNLTNQPVKGKATLTLFDPFTEKTLLVKQQRFEVGEQGETALTFAFEVDDSREVLGIRLVAEGARFSDGEQHLIPVLSDKEQITETLPLSVKGEEVREFSLDSLFNRNHPAATNRRLTLEFTANPAWYAVQALPALAEAETDNAISWAAAYYAATLAASIANSHPRIQTVVEAWKASGNNRETFRSNLSKNPELKEMLLSESPWLLEAETASEQQEALFTLLDVNQQTSRAGTLLTRLREFQNRDGSFCWYKGMETDLFVTFYVTELLTRLPLLTGTPLVPEAQQIRDNTMNRLMRFIREDYEALKRAGKLEDEECRLSQAQLDFLYLMAISGRKVTQEAAEAYRFFLSRVQYESGSLFEMRKARAIVILHKAGRTEEAARLLASLKEHLTTTDEKGAHFAYLEGTAARGMFPVSFHVAAMEALSVAGDVQGTDAPLLEAMKQWLLKQKQTQAWKNPVATTDAVYALLCWGSDPLQQQGDVRITLGKQVMRTADEASSSVIPGLGYLKRHFTAGDAALKARKITVDKQDAGAAWGALYAQYLIPVADLQEQGTGLSVSKELFVERVGGDGKLQLLPLTATEVRVGELVVTRLVVRLDRDMDYLHLKDRRAACLEPLSTASGYSWRNGRGCYVEVEDASVNCFYQHLKKGVYVMEHRYRVSRAGEYQTGVATVGSAYAAEFKAHSSGGLLKVTSGQ